MLQIADIPFELTEASLDAYIDAENDLIAWGIEISGRTTQPGFERWKPTARCETLLSTGPGDLASWHDLAGRSVEWSRAEDEDGEAFATLYLFEHSPIYDATVHLSNGGAGGLMISWAGRFDPHINDDYNEGVSLSVRESVVFCGVWCGRASEEASWRSLEPFFPRDQFAYTQTDHGVSLLVPAEVGHDEHG